MSEYTITTCSCGNKNGTDHTDVPAYTTVQAFVLDKVGYAMDALPPQYHGGGWVPAYIGVCKRHHNNWVHGKALVINHFIQDNSDMEDTVTRTPTTWDDPELQRAQEIGNQLFPKPTTGIKCGNTKTLGEHYHPTINDVKTCFNVPKGRVIKRPGAGDYFEKGRNIRKIKNPYQR